jgi:putative ABC transport system permease protein
MNDLKLAWRSFRKHASMASIAVLTLAIAIGSAVAIFSVLRAVLLEPLPAGDPDQIVIIRDAWPPRFAEFSVSPGRFVEWQKRGRVFDGIAATQGTFVNLTGRGEPERLRAVFASPNFFTVMHASPLQGRVFRPDEDYTTPANLAILSEDLWRTRFGGDPGLIGQPILLNDTATTVVGVMPEAFTIPSTPQLWLLMALNEKQRVQYGSHYMNAFGRMKPGISVAEAQADLERAAREIESIEGNEGWTVMVASLHAYATRNVRGGLWVLSAAVGVVLLIACANVANLLLARGAGRLRELGVRAALGATRARLTRQMLVENALLGAIGTIAGIFTAWAILRLLVANAPATLPRAAEITLDPRTLLFALLLAAVTPLLFGLLPALQIARADVQSALAHGGRAGGSGMRARTRAALIVGEVSLAVMLVAGTTLLLKSFDRLIAVSPGYSADHGLVVGLNLPSARYSTNERLFSFWRALVERAAALPGVEHAGVSQSVPMVNDYVSSLDIPGKTPEEPSERPSANFYAISPGYFSALGIRLIAGREPSFGDGPESPRVAVISESVARRYFAGENPIGQRLRISQGPRNDYAEVVGIAADVKQYGLDRETTLQVYEPLSQHQYFGAMSLVLRTRVAPETMTNTVRALVRELDPNLPIASARALSSVLDDAVGPRRFTTTLLAAFAGVALLLSAIGVYGLVSFSVGQRTQEIGVRMALGAKPGSVMRLVFRHGLQLALVGAIIGIVGGLFAARWLESLLFEVSMRDPAAFVLAPAVLLAAAALACYWPARRALRVDPVTALRPH